MVVDDHLAFAEALAQRLDLEPDIVVSAVVTSAEAAVREVAVGEVDLALLDVNLPDADGISLVGRLKDVRPAVRIVMITAGGDPEQVADAIRAGAVAWVAKDDSVEHVLEAVRGALRDETRVPARLLTGALAILLRTERQRSDAEEMLSKLTPREAEVLACMAEGLGRAEIAERMYLSPNTVRTHMQSVLGKLGVHSSLAAVALGRRIGIC